MAINSDPSKPGFRDAETLFRSKLISEIRNVETITKNEIESKKEELRQLVGNRVRVYGIASRVKYLVDTPENIWGCLDESMFLEASGRYLRAKVVHGLVTSNSNSNVDREFLSNFPLLQHQWQIVESFKGQISQRSRERLMDRGLEINAYSDALAAVAVIDDLDPKQVLGLFLESRKSWVSMKLGSCKLGDCDSDYVVSVFCDVVRIIQVSLGQVGELFLQVLNDMPLFYKTILGSPPGSQLFGGLPNPEEEVRLWKLHREKLESVMVVLEKDYIADVCSNWLKNCGQEIVSKIHGRYLVDIIKSGQELASAEKLIRQSLDSREVLEGSLEWLKSVFGSEIELPWNNLRELVLKDNEDLWDGIFEDAFVRRMKFIVNSGFEDLKSVVNAKESVQAIVVNTGDVMGLHAYLSRPSTGGGVWFLEANSRKTGTVTGLKATPDEKDFHTCLNAYFGPEVARIRDAVDSRYKFILEDLLCFLESQKAASRLKELAPYLQEKCYESVSAILGELEEELGHLSTSLGNGKEDMNSTYLVTIVERSLFIGRFLFALRNHSSHIPLILGSPRLWVNETITSVFEKLAPVLGNSRFGLESPSRDNFRRKSFDSPSTQNLISPRRQTSSATVALFGVDDSANPKLELLSSTSRDLCIRAHSLWITWVSDELSAILSENLKKDDALSATTPLRGWEETVIRQVQSGEGSPEMTISLPSMPSLYVISFLFQACGEVHRVGGHVLDKSILHKLALRLSEMVLGVYGNFVSTLEVRNPPVTEKGVLQILFDLRFTVDVLSGGDVNMKEELPRVPKSKLAFKQNQDQNQLHSTNKKVVMGLINNLSQRLDPIDWATYEPYLWENGKQAYLRLTVLFGFLTQLNRMHTSTAPKLPSNTESNTMRCSTVPRFKYLPISAPALSSKGTAKSSLSISSDDISSRSSWKAYSNGELSPKLEFDDASSFSVATPFLKSFMQVGSRFGESTLKLGSMLTDGQVGRLKDFGDMLPVQAAGLLSSFTAGRSDY
ncbi:hypothetical protein IFM89_012343 [Coptis chinensis]|uniref:Conserved oligomeric Golgi complex subunit 1 n=1 Tax=Coptis chinensis TaxID=261450 RepID=A0A835I1U6_9MAGN|nr:hypothetical protein IFM89_012343 [Coptis chinensis]